MDSTQLINIVESLKNLKPYFRGIYACNTLSDGVRRFPSAYVCNTDPIEKKGTHWVAYWFDSVNQCEFFDSFGRTPEDYDERLRDFVDRNSPLCLYNNIQVQPDFSSTCGLHVLYYLNARARGISMSDIVNKTSEMRVRDILPNRD